MISRHRIYYNLELTAEGGFFPHNGRESIDPQNWIDRTLARVVCSEHQSTTGWFSRGTTERATTRSTGRYQQSASRLRSTPARPVERKDRITVCSPRTGESSRRDTFP
ncbi:hypothetical protein D8Y22_20845 [Salinadaptatus halalkaliphilus]|uniref:Uncharacterized protein n=1 Tax=Salinadaptatus halalkaliphilus TaxID=2419781 RepID=A0A4S3TG52_9EURY|nr:hypothetical protein D8Y22_20845 [Salinadaptatus halalkaliphilus]